MKCPECETEIPSLPCEFCREQKETWARMRRQLSEEFGLIEGPPESERGRASLEFALTSMRRRLDAEGFQGTISFNPDALLRSAAWWYIPYRWIGCAGFIVDRAEGYVNWLGSCHSLSDCFWGHQHGLVTDPVDITFTDEVPIAPPDILMLMRRFQHYVPARDGSGDVAVWYSDHDAERTIKEQWPTFRRQCVWFAIPELRAAANAQKVSFRAQRSADE